MTEYFVTYYKTVYPDCRTAGTDDKPIKKRCFTSKGCLKTSKSKTFKRTVCNRKKMENGCEQYDWVCGGQYPHTCITEPCPKSKQVADCRVSVGTLDDEEEELLKTEMDMLGQRGFSLEKICFSSLKEKYDHESLLKKYETLEEYFEKYKSFEGYTFAFGQRPDYFEFLKKCKEIADRIRSLQKATIEDNTSLSDTTDTNQRTHQTTTVGLPPPFEAVRETSAIDSSNEPIKVHIDTLGNAAKEVIKDTITNAISTFHNPLHETEAEKWDRISQDRFNGEGWVELAKMNLTNQGKTYTKTEIRDESTRIRKLVERHRSGK